MKSKMKNVLLMGLSLVLVAVIAIGGTVAYLTDRDSKTNVFTVGNVSIKLNEDYQQGSRLIPGVDIKKEATITNTGKNDAWVWLTVLLPEEMGPYTAPDNMSATNNVVHWNYPQASAANITVDFISTPVAVDTDGDGVTESYYQTNMLWNTVLKAGETTDIMLSKVYMDKHVDIDPDGNMYWVEDGEATDLGWNINEKGSPVIYVSAYAIQAEGFECVQDAYAEYGEQWGDNGGIESEKVTTVSTAQELKEASGLVVLSNDIELTETIDVNGELTVIGDGNTIISPADSIFTLTDGDKLTLMDVKIEGEQGDERAVYVHGGRGNELTMENVEISNVAVGVSSFKPDIGTESFSIKSLKNLTIKASNIGLELYGVNVKLIESCTVTAPTAMLLASGPEHFYGANATVKDCTLNGEVALGCWNNGVAKISLAIDNCSVSGKITARAAFANCNDITVTAITGSVDKTSDWYGTYYTYTPAN